LSTGIKGQHRLEPGDLLDMLRKMVAIRVFDERAEKLHFQGALSGPFHSSVGQEAVAAGVCTALKPTDVITSTHRGHGHLLAKGADMPRMLAELKGRVDGYSHGLGGSMHIADMSVGAIGENGIVGASIFLGTGAGLGFQLDGSGRIAAAIFGDGAIGQGVLYECLNLAAIWLLPVVFVCENNQYAHSFSVRKLAKAGDLVDRVATYGVPGVKVDGTDAVAVRTAMDVAVDRARRGDGPSLVMADCYRWRGHNLSDADHLYRRREEVMAARQRDPIMTMRQHLQNAGIDLRILEGIEQDAQAAFDVALSFAEESDLPVLDLILDGVP
jgi:TPP-dependent pyruvate/acetoin dehydrogenase alpha subunit